MKIVTLVYPGVTPLDLVGPLQVWSSWPGAHVEIAARTLDPLATDTVMQIVPTHTYTTAAADPDILFVPGGTDGTLAAIADDGLLAFVRDRGGRAGWVTSVCTGALVLGAAGLLRGYESTTHWLVLDELKRFGARPVKARWVIDRNRAAGGGVSAGIDFGLALMARIVGEDHARMTQLAIEYAPDPPFRSGTPDEARPETREAVRSAFRGFVSALDQMTAVLADDK